MAREVVHDDDVPCSQVGHQNLRNISFEPVAVDRTVEHHRCDNAAHAQTERGGLAVTMEQAHPQAQAFPAAAMAAGHVGGSPRLVDEYEALRLQIELLFEPVSALPQDLGTVLPDRVPVFFYA